jgi:hypothetical protein
MTNRLDLSIQGFSDLEDRGTKEDGTPDIRVKRGYDIRLTLNCAQILFEETLPCESVPVAPTEFLVKRLAAILAPYLPRIDPR